MGLRVHLASFRAVALEQPVLSLLVGEVLYATYWGMASSIEDLCGVYDALSIGKGWVAKESHIIDKYIFKYTPENDRIAPGLYERFIKRFKRGISKERPSRDAFHRSIALHFYRRHPELGGDGQVISGMLHLDNGIIFSAHGMYAKELFIHRDWRRSTIIIEE